MSGGKIGSESRQDFRFVELPKLLASFATPLIVPTVLISAKVMPKFTRKGKAGPPQFLNTCESGCESGCGHASRQTFLSALASGFDCLQRTKHGSHRQRREGFLNRLTAWASPRASMRGETRGAKRAGRCPRG
ncbi:hypothetical protein LF1_12820 [Rubripirellula obstinata]|uniref:Uncharacterized protein n=1 Tax=Rubripirellula obstinata TaxID=406547 RepID=A0A5B1CG90_9BACT|nr:hypothetical protein LF1_12820 [Rubripirellula obstinata]